MTVMNLQANRQMLHDLVRFLMGYRKPTFTGVQRALLPWVKAGLISVGLFIMVTYIMTLAGYFLR